MEDLLTIIEQFRIAGTPERADSFGSGHIHATYKVQTLEPSAPDYLLQEINREVFGDVQGLMENIYKVTEYLKSKKISGSQQVLTLIPTKEGQLFYQDNGHCWRMFKFIAGAHSYEKAETEKQAFEAAKMFGLFLRDLSDFPVDDLHITIPNFHNIEFRLQQFRESLAEAHPQRKKKARKLIEMVQSNSPRVLQFYKSATSGDLPLRVTHNDCKFNNVLLDKDGYGYAVVDLDTVMPGYVFYDVGDGLRTGAVTAAEDEQELDLVNIDDSKYEAFINGYLQGAGDILTEEELKSISIAGYYMAYIMGVRFLSDYLKGDVYYKVAFAEHNYFRARCQLYVAERFKKKIGDTRQMILKYRR